MTGERENKATYSPSPMPFLEGTLAPYSHIAALPYLELTPHGMELK